ncbi:MAG TPA: TlpA disulfide reductase family protein [Kofleriaceae bacterium]|nr:TlpA disulfide reductase family protein [Kofleriaceae bacterium]
MAAISVGAGCKKGVPVPDGDVAATLTVPSADDAKPFDPASLRGKPTLVLFASPTCHYCAQELPRAQAAATAENANLVAVFIAGAKKHAMSATQSLGFTGSVLVDDGTLRKRYDIKGVPYTLILGADGHARDAFRGLQDESTLRDALADAR